MDGFFELSIGGFQLLFPAYSTFVGLGAMLFMFCFYAQISKLGISYYQFLACCFLMGVGMVLGSKTLFILTCLPEVFNNFSWQLLWNTIATSGFVFYGGLFGAIAGVLAASRIIGIKFNDLLNAVVLGFPLFHACGRIGCFFTGCCYGIKWDSRLFAGIGLPVSRFPVQLVESCCRVIIFVILLILRMNGSTKLAEQYLVLYALCRFVLEFFRGDAIRGVWYGMSTSQWISLVILGWGVLFEIKGRCRRLSI